MSAQTVAETRNNSAVIGNATSPLIGFVIATLNASARLQACLDSIYRQDDSSWEIVIIDGGSTDGTLDIIRRNTPRLRYWRSEPDGGVYDAWNKAIPHLTAQWVHFLGAEDLLYAPDIVGRLRPILSRDPPRHRIIYGSVALINETGELIQYLGKPWDEIEQRFKTEMCIPHQGILHHRDLFAGGAHFDPSFRFAGDYELLLRELKDHAPYFCDNVCVAAWRIGGISTNSQYSFDVLREFRAARSRHGLSAGRISWTETKAYGKRLLRRLFGLQAANKVIDTYRILSNRGPLYRARGIDRR
jgi:glycosyltransferase involved in cell wall biosynthesis